MRSLINHLQAQCKLYSLEASRCKKQCKDLEEEVTKLKAKQEATVSNGFSQQSSVATPEPASAGSVNSIQHLSSPTIKDEMTTTNPLAAIEKMETMPKEESIEGVCCPATSCSWDHSLPLCRVLMIMVSLNIPR